MRVRLAQVTDIPAMMDVGRDSAATAQWSRRYYETLFARTASQQLAERVAWVVEDQAKQTTKALTKAPEILAFLVAHRVETEWELENIVVKSTARRRGIGTRLLDEFLAHARSQRGSFVFLEVRESNHSARALYRKARFEESGLRKSYYSSPQEDAILCRLSLY